jgi:hypothetical protein
MQNGNDTKRVWRAIPCKTQQIPWMFPATNGFCCVLAGNFSLNGQIFEIREDVPDVCPDAGKSRQDVQAQIYCSEESGRASLAVHLVNKASKEHLDVR